MTGTAAYDEQSAKEAVALIKDSYAPVLRALLSRLEQKRGRA